MGLDRAYTLIQGLQKDAKLYDTLKEIANELNAVINIDVTKNLLVDADYIHKRVGWIRDDRFNTINLYDRQDKVVIGDLFGQKTDVKLKVTNLVNDHVLHEVVSIKRSRADTIKPNANFGAGLTFRLQGSTVYTEPIACEMDVQWENNQTNDTTDRDAKFTLFLLANNALFNAFSINSAGDGAFAPAGPSTNVKLLVDKGSGPEGVVIASQRNDSSTDASIQINNSGTGDSMLRFQFDTAQSFAMGMDDSDNDYFKISYAASGAAALGTNDRFVIDLSGRIVINGSTFTAGRLLQLNHFEEGPWIHCESTFLNPAITLSNTGSGGQVYQIISTRTGGTGAAGAFVVRDNTAAQNRLIIAPNGNFVVGHLAALATNATDGFLYIPSCAGTPTGTPTAFTGKIPLVYDSTNNILYAYSNGAWSAH